METTKDKIISVGKGALISAAGAGLAYLSQYISGADFGIWTPALVAVLSVLVNVFRKTVPITPVK